MANFNTNIIIKREILEEDTMPTGDSEEFEVWDGIVYTQSQMGEELKVKEEVSVDGNIDKYLKMWKSLYPLVDEKTKISIYNRNNGDIRQTMAKIRKLDKKEKIKKRRGVQNVQCTPHDMILDMNEGTLENQTQKHDHPQHVNEDIVKHEIEVNVKEEVGVNDNIDKYLRIWKSLFPLVDDKTKISIYTNSDNDIRKTMAKLREMSENEKTKMEKAAQNVQCSHRDKIFSNKKELDCHLTSLKKITREKLYLGGDPYMNQDKMFRGLPPKCKHCEKTFSNKIDLTNHLKGHIDEMKVMMLQTYDKPYKCSHCGKAFSWKSQLNQHLRWIRTKGEPYECNYCDETSLWKCQIEGHMATHMKENPKMHPGEW